MYGLKMAGEESADSAHTQAYNREKWRILSRRTDSAIMRDLFSQETTAKIAVVEDYFHRREDF